LQAKKMDFYCKINLLSNGTFYESINPETQKKITMEKNDQFVYDFFSTE